MAIKRSKKQSLAIRRGATRPTKTETVTPVKTSQQPGLGGTPVLSPQTQSHHVLAAVYQDATSTTTMAEEAQQPGPVTALALSPQARSRDAHGHFLAKKVM